MNNWTHLLSTALVGTDRQSLALPAENEPLASLLAQLETNNQTAYLLSAAAVYTQYQRASFQPSLEQPPLPEPAPPDAEPLISPHAASYLQQMLDGHHPQVLPEWLTAVYTTGQRIPPELLPALLARGAQNTNLRPDILAVIGARGRWLAGLNPAWHYARPPADPAQWESATGPARLALFQQLRAIAPDEARLLLQRTWPTEKAEDRAAFLACLGVNLSLADEPFLESCLDQDKSIKVRQTAADLLARLPDSQLVARMMAHVRPLLKLEGRLRPSLTVTLPDKPDAARQRDGIQPGKAPAPLQMGEKAWHLCQMLACVPLTIWSEQWAKSPDTLVQLAARSEEATLLLEGWRQAALRHPHLAWTTALIAQGAPAAELVAALPPAQRESAVLTLIESKPNTDPDTLFQWLGSCQQQWSETYGRLVIKQVQKMMAASQSTASQNRMWLLTLARYFPPPLADDATNAWKPNADTAVIWQPVIDQFIELLHFRRDMLAALHPPQEIV